MKEGENKEKT